MYIVIIRHRMSKYTYCALALIVQVLAHANVLYQQVISPSSNPNIEVVTRVSYSHWASVISVIDYLTRSLSVT